ncbi:MAG: protein O-GlcNAc transferase [Phycisphaerales bacterium]|jgi:predicted O-linked N-acetylglucosamine transferase (SPINDLY family)|nr:protein O-GlcNAc transferase [Phycisphaerales bacterium]
MSTAPQSPAAAIEQALSVAVEHHRAGRLAQAETIYRQVLAADPNQADALHLLGMIAQQAGQHQHAEQLLARAIRVQPNSPEFHFTLAQVFRTAGRADESIAAYRRAIELDPTRADAHAELGAMYHERGDIDAAMRSFWSAATLRPDDAAAYSNLCAELVTLKRYEEAVVAGQHAVELRPDWADAWSNYGAALYRAKRIDDSIAAYGRAISLKPDHADAHANLALALIEQHRFAEAEAACHEAIRLAPASAQGYSNLGNVLKRQARFTEAVTAYDKSVELNPRSRPAWANMLLTLSYLDDRTPEEIFRRHRAWAAQYAEPLLREMNRDTAAATPTAFANDRDPNRRLRLGYISPDLFQHAVAFFLEPLLTAHDHTSAVEVFLYSDVDHADVVTDRLRAMAADDWRDVHGMPDAALADLIRRDRIDVLVDLAGHTRRNRLMVFAMRAAPVQISYLGYPATTGVPAMDYRLTDALADPPGMTDAHFTEQLLRLPRCAWCYRAADDAPPPAPQPPCLASGGVTFGSFNKHHKISPATIEMWVKLLAAVPDARLLLKSNRLRDDMNRRRLMGEFTARGVDEGRVEILPPAASIAEHLAAHARVDVALDTFPYHGTTTTCDALFMGVPVVALGGRTHVSRVAVSLLSAVGLRDLIGDDIDGYVSIAAALARDPDRLSRLRMELRPRMQSSPLMDATGLARAVEAAYRSAWQTWCRQPAGAA